MQEKLLTMSELAKENIAKAQQRQKKWYDENARERQTEPGSQVLVLLPTETSKLLAQWHGPYPVFCQMSPVNYEVDMYDKKKRHWIFHVNMLRKGHAPSAVALLANEVPEKEEEELPLSDANPCSDEDQPVISERLDRNQQIQLRRLLQEFKDILSSRTGRTTLMEHKIDTGEAFSGPYNYNLIDCHRPTLKQFTRNYRIWKRME